MTPCIHVIDRVVTFILDFFVLTHSVCRMLLNNRGVDRGVDRGKNDFLKVVDVLSVLIRAQAATVVTAPHAYIHLSGMSSYAKGYISREQRTAISVWPLTSDTVLS